MTSPTSKSAPPSDPLRQRSISFPDSEADDSRRQVAESSADEITPIVAHQRGSRRYDGSTSPTNRAQDGESPAGNGSSSGVSKRKLKSNRTEDNPSNDHAADPPSSTTSSTSPKRGPWAWLRDTAEKYGSVELENKGSVARDHLALERTFLAWLRTSLAFASIGIAVTQLFRLNTSIEHRRGYEPANPPQTAHLRQVGKPLGATFLAIAIVVLVVGGRRYFESQYWIIRGKFPASRGSVFFITAVAACLIVTSLVVVVVIDPSVFEKR